MTLEELNNYFNLILEKYSNNEYETKNFKFTEPVIDDFHLEAQHYMMYEWYEDHWYDDYETIFNHILIPKDCDEDFYNTDFKDFLKFLSSIKVK